MSEHKNKYRVTMVGLTEYKNAGQGKPTVYEIETTEGWSDFIDRVRGAAWIEEFRTDGSIIALNTHMIGAVEPLEERT